MTNEEKRAVYRFIERLTLSDIETLMRDEASAYLVQSGLKKILNFLGYLGFGRMPGQRTKGPEF